MAALACLAQIPAKMPVESATLLAYLHVLVACTDHDFGDGKTAVRARSTRLCKTLKIVSCEVGM